MKKALIILTCAALLLSGCESKNLIKVSEEITLSEYKTETSKGFWATLYYPASDYSRMLAYSMEFTNSDSVTKSIADVLFSSANEGYISPFPKNTKCRSISLVQNILYIDLSSAFLSLSGEKFYGCVSSIVFTFCELPQVEYVNITVEGKQLSSPETKKQIMLLSKYNGNITDLIARYTASGTVDTFYACIYEYDSSKQYLLPTVKSITAKAGGYASAILENMLNYESEKSIFPRGTTIYSPISLEGDTLNITLICQNSWAQNDLWLGFDCCGASLSYLYPTATSLNLRVIDKSGATVYSKKASVSNCYDLIRSKVDIFVADGEKLGNSSMLVSRLAGQDDLKSFTVQYLETLNPDFAKMPSLVNDVTFSSDTVIIDLSKEYFDYYASLNLSSGEEYAVVYSLISTLCEYSSATKAMILQNSQIRSRFNKSVVLSSPLIALPNSFLDSLG